MDPIIPTPTKRIEYIDALRGFTMILVVFSHIIGRTFCLESSFCNAVFISFRMPLFFFISGFIGYKANIVWNKHKCYEMIKKRVMTQLFPTLVLSLIYTYAYLHMDIGDLIANNLKLGYWFTIVLFEMFFIVYAINTFFYSPNSEIFKKRQLISVIICSILCYGFLFIVKVIPPLEEFCNIFSLNSTFKYFPFFAFGYICSMNKELFYGIFEKEGFVVGVIVAFCILFYINNFYVYPHLTEGLFFRVCFLMVGSLVSFSGLLIVFNTFRTYQDSFTSDKKVGDALQYIGKRTLDIYLLHYFFLPYIPQLGKLLSDGRNAVLELAIGGGLSLLVVMICLVVSNILRSSPILAKYLFGAKK